LGVRQGQNLHSTVTLSLLSYVLVNLKKTCSVFEEVEAFLSLVHFSIQALPKNHAN